MKRTLVNLITCQTIATESLETVKDGLREEVRKSFEDRLLNGRNRNRSEKRVLNRLIEDKLKDFDKVIRDYVTITNRLVKHFDDCESTEELDRLVNEMYDFLESKEILV